MGDAGGAVARFESPDGEARLTLARASFAGSGCSAAAAAAVKAASGAQLAAEGEFGMSAGGSSFAAGQGVTGAEGRKGAARYYCRGAQAVALEASASTESFLRWQGEMEGALDSLSYDGPENRVAIRRPVQAPPAYFVHVVRFRGQTLGRIVEWYTGEYENWRKVARVNEDLPVPNTDLKVGREIKIPAELLKRQDPLPEPRKRAAHSSPQPKTRGQAPSGQPPPPTQPSETAPLAPAEAEEQAAPLPPVIGPR
ncbi:MAG: hypothetical protein HYY35_08780 [Deltaproteobacteria bacterium]|nr:hypothetical protein [Deltaproteobacteria bacterium]